MSTDMAVDILIRDINKQSIAIIEVKIWSKVSHAEMRELLNRIFSFTTFDTPIPYFLLVTPKTGFLWQQPKPNDPPNLEFSMEEVVVRYLSDPVDRQNLRETQFELIILEWLTDLAWLSGEVTTEPEKSLAVQGFLKAIRGASVLPEVQLHARIR